MTKSLPGNEAASSPRPALRRPMILLSLFLVLGCFVVSISILAAHGLHPPVFSAVIVIEAEPGDEGAIVTITGPIPGPLSKPVERGEHFAPCFNVPAGDYSLRVERDGKTILSRPVVHAGRYQYVIVTIPHPQTQPTSRN